MERLDSITTRELRMLEFTSGSWKLVDGGSDSLPPCDFASRSHETGSEINLCHYGEGVRCRKSSADVESQD